MELVSSPPTPKPKLTTILVESHRLIKSHRRHFSALFLAYFFIGLLFQIPSFCIVGDGDSVPGSDDNGHLAQFLTVRIYLIGLVGRIFSLLTFISITSVALQRFGKSASSLNSVAKLISASFFPLVATNLLQLAISFLVILGFAAIFGCVVILAFFLGFQIEPKSPFFQLLAFGFVVSPSVLVTMYLNFVSWGMVTTVVVAESTWGFAALKRSKSLVNGKRSLAVILFIIFVVSYIIVGLISKSFSSVAGLEEKKSFVAMVFMSVAQLVVTWMITLYELVAYTLFYVFCKAAHEEGLNGDSQYVKLAIDDCEKVGEGSKLNGYCWSFESTS